MQTGYERYQEQLEKERENQKLLDEKYKQCFSKALETEHGKCAFQLLHKLCLWDEISDSDTSDSLIYKKGRRDIWLMIRQYIPKVVLTEIEIYKQHEITIK